MRFIGIDAWRTNKDCENWDKLWARKDEFMHVLDSLTDEYGTQITENCSMMHHNGKEVDTENHYLVGRFFRPEAPVPEVSAYYFTRDRILEDGIVIPYPHAYWHAAVYFNPRPQAIDDSNLIGRDYRFGYMFSVGALD